MQDMYTEKQTKTDETYTDKHIDTNRTERQIIMTGDSEPNTQSSIELFSFRILDDENECL